MESNKPKAMTAYERRKRMDERKKAQGYTRKSYYQHQTDIELIHQVREQLAAKDDQATNEEALSYILDFYRKNAL